MSSKKKYVLYLISLLIIVLLIFLVSILKESDSSYIYTNKVQRNGSLTINYPYFNKDNIDNVIENYISKINNIKVDKVNYSINFAYGYQSILFIKYYDNKIIDYDSFIFDNKNNLISINDIVKDELLLQEKINLYLDLNNIIIDESESIKYDYILKSDELEVIITSLSDKTKIFNIIYINYNELDDILLFDYLKDLNYNKVLTTTVPTNPPKKDPDKVIAFTFDDGPSKYTTQILDILDAYGAKATFFEVGYMMKNRKDTVKEVLARGHEIGNHTTDHSNLNKLTAEKIKSKVYDNNALFKDITGEDFSLLRPPYGNCKQSIRELINVPIIKWSVDSRDWESRNKEKIIDVVKKQTTTGDIVLFHDLYESTLEAIKVLVPYFYEQGYTIVSVSELYDINNIDLEPSHVYYSAKEA